jgi:hypothetical protein
MTSYTAIPYRGEKRTCREVVPVSKTSFLKCEQDPCNENRFKKEEVGNEKIVQLVKCFFRFHIPLHNCLGRVIY